MSSLGPGEVAGADSSRSRAVCSCSCSRVPAWPGSLSDGFVSPDGSESATAGLLKECGQGRAAISLPQPKICPLVFFSPAAECDQSPPRQHAAELQYPNQSSRPQEGTEAQ